MKKRPFYLQRIWSIILCVGIFASQALSLSYYVSSAGSDANSGTSTSSPWKSISKVNSFTFTSGDAIYFRGGDTFSGQININQSNITLGSYDSGNKPVITGAVQLSGWTVYSGSIYVAQASSLVKNLFANGVQMTLARYPNSGFIYITSKSSSTTFSASGVTQSSGYWNGANCRLRTNAWTYESPTVSTQNGTTIVLASAPYFIDTFTEGWGFYLDNKLAALDVAGEWYCDPASNKVYFYAPNGVNPNNLTVTGSTLDYGVNSSSNYITVRDLEFHYQSKAGLSFSGSNISLLSNTVYGGLADGIDLRGTNCTVNSNIIQNVNGNGIHLFYSAKDGTITNNTIKSIGLVRGYQSPASAYGILSEGTYATIGSNYIDSVGYDGIYAFSHDLVEKNIIKNTMVTMSDGGAIYTGSGSSYVTIQNNFISDVYGNNEATGLWGGSYQSWSTAVGIYLDGGSNNAIARNNTIIRAKSIALFVNYSTSNHTVTNNTAYDCASNTGGYFLFLALNTSLNDGGHSITNNIFYPASSNQKLVQIQDFSSVVHSPGILDNNYFLNPHGNANPFETQLNKSNGWWIDMYTFTGWKSLTGMEANSKYIIPESNKRDTIIFNSTANPITVNLPPFLYYDLDNNSVAGSFTLAPFASKVLIRDNVSTGAATTTVNPASLSFGNIAVNASSEQTYTLAGSNLTPASGNITITAPSTAYQVSLTTGSGFASTLNVPYTGSTLSSKTIYVRFTPTAAQSYTGNIASTGGGATAKNLSVTGTGTSASTAILTVNPTSLSFGNIAINTNSNELTYTLTGSNLSPAADSLTITAPIGFTISTVSGSGFTSSKRIAYTNGTLSAKTIYVRLSPTEVSGYGINIANSGGGATTKNVGVTGMGISPATPALVVNQASLSFGNVVINTPSSEQSYTLTGSNLSPASGNVAITAPAGYQVSVTSGSGFSSSMNVAYSGGTLPSTAIFAKFTPTAAQSYAGDITSAGGGTTKNVSVTGTGTSAPTPLLTAAPTSLTFEDVIANAVSNEQSYILAGSNLSPASGSVTITAPAGYQVSVTSGTGFSSSLDISYTGGVLASETIYIRFAPTAAQSYTCNITSSCSGATTKNVSVTGTGISAPTPTLTVNPTSLSFGNVVVSTISSEQAYTLTGSNLSPAADSLTITAPIGFTISTVSGSGFTSSKRIAYTNGTLSAKTIYVRLSPTEVSGYGINIANSGGGAAIKNVAVTGMGISATTPMLSVNPTSLSFGNVIINTPSSEQTHTLTGLNLSPASGNVTITAPAGYQVSVTSGSGFSSSLNVAYSGGTLPSTTIYVKFTPTAAQSYTGDITSAGGGTTKNVSVSGSGINNPSPVITVNSGSISFSNVRINTISSEMTYTIQGSYLSPESGNITITPPSGYQVSAVSGSGFSSTLNVPYTSGTLSSTIIYVRFSPTAIQNYSGSITNAGGAATQNVAVTGTGISTASAALTVNVSSLSFGNVVVNTASRELTYTLTGLNLTPSSDSLTIIAPPGFTISTVSGSGFASSKRIAYINGTLQPIPKIIYVRFSPTAVQSYSDSITNSGGNAGSMTVRVSGSGITNLPAPTGTFVASADILPSSGGYVTLTWTSANASQASINNGIRTVAMSGSITRYIRSTTRFILTLSNINGTVSYAKTITVRPRKLTKNLALNMPSSASSIELSGSEPNKANDGIATTSWSSAFVDNQWWQVDLQKITTIEDISLVWDESFASEFTISTSIDGLIFNDVATGYACGLDDTTRLNFDPINTRYIRLTGVQRGTELGISVFEFGAFASLESLSTPVDPTPQTPNSFTLEQNYPNPFNPSTTIGYQISRTAEVRLVVYDVLGKEITTLVNQVQNAGHHTVTFNANNLASGIYYARLVAEGSVQIKKMMLIK